MPTTSQSDAPIAPSTQAAGHEIAIKCVSLTKVFKDFWMRSRVRAVDAISIDVLRGEVFGLLGPNGSGKSTTIKMILGLLHPSEGKIAVFGRHPRDVQTKRAIGYLPEESYLYKFLNARETLEYYARLFHIERSKRRQRIDQLLEYVGLDKVQHRPIGEYSKGMQRRIGLAQALINDPQMLILDEPTTGMDPIGTRQIKDLILDLKQRGKTILLCSHLLADVEDVTDRVAIMFGGKVRRYGRLEDLLAREGLTNIHADHLEPEDLEAVEAVLAARGKHIERVDRPRQTLESLFMNIVHEARHQGLQTAGAGAGGRTAAFLTGGEVPASAGGTALIDELVRPTRAQEPAVAETSGIPREPQTVAPVAASGTDVAGDTALIAELTGSPASSPAPKSEASESSQEERKPDRPVADRGVIDDLLG